ncbi:MAG: DNA repair protein RecN, partial [Bacteroidetes bacterium]
ASMQAECDKQHTKLLSQAKAISEKRKKAIPEMENTVNRLLAQVQMADAKISLSQEVKTTLHYFGIDQVELRFAANNGSQFQPINKVASGGELSRLMLCIKSLISDKIALPTIVFDEIDTGISGETALKVSKVMKQHAAKHQVIAITHLPQIASKADNHLYVYKTAEKNNTFTHILTLQNNARIEEIARMMHGANPSAKVIEAAKELINS